MSENRRNRRIGVLAMLVAVAPVTVEAHVKWFCAISDVTAPPVSIGAVMTSRFVAIAILFVSLVFAGFVLDGVVARRWPRLVSSGRTNEVLEERLIRLAVGAYFLLLWDKGADVPWLEGSAILTPELIPATPWMGLLQFAVAVSLGWRRTCILGAAGIMALYGMGVASFGVFHMTDYIFFPGLAAYLALSSVGAWRWRVPVVSGCLAFSLMWTAIEKFLYPEWTLFVIGTHPSLAAGFPPGFVVVMAGFIEFTLAFYFMTGRGLVRFGAAAFAGIFIAAIPEFGHLDSVGHLPIVGIMAVVCLRGASPLQRLFGLLGRRPLTNAAVIAALYVVVLIGFFGAYYGLQWSEYGAG